MSSVSFFCLFISGILKPSASSFVVVVVVSVSCSLGCVSVSLSLGCVSSWGRVSCCVSSLGCVSLFGVYCCSFIFPC